MCYPASFVLTRDSVYWSKTTNSHNAIIREHGLCEDVAYNPVLLRVEVRPDDSDYTRPMSEWTYCTDQVQLPTWSDSIRDEKRVRAAMLEWQKYHCLCIVKPGIVEVGDCCTVVGGCDAKQTVGDWSTQKAGPRAIQKAGACAMQEAHDHATQTALNRAVQFAGNDSQQTSGDGSTQTAGARARQQADYAATQTAGHDANQRGGRNATQVAGNNSTQQAGIEAVQTAGHRSKQYAGRESLQQAGVSSLQIAGGCSTQTASTLSIQVTGEYSTQTVGDNSFQRAGLGTVQINRWSDGCTFHMSARVVDASTANKWQYVLRGVWRDCTQEEITKIEAQSCQAFRQHSNG
jgi:hypothetical protein